MSSLRSFPKTNIKIALLRTLAFSFLFSFFGALVLASGQTLEPPLPNPADPVGTMGICYHYVDGTPPAASEVNALKAAGFTWVRTDLKWNNIENPGQDGNYYWGYFDTVYHAFHDSGLRVMFILDYNNPNYDNGYSVYDDTGRAAYARFAAAAAVHYNSLGGGVVFEVFNEPENFWSTPPYLQEDKLKMYAQMALTASQAIKQAVPTAHVVGPAAGWAWNSELMNDVAATTSTGGAFQYMDGASYHQYYYNPEQMGANQTQANTFFASIAQYNAHLNSFITEQGYGTDPGDKSPELQAQLTARTLLYGVYSRLALNFLYVWHEPGVYSHATGETYLVNNDNAYGIVDNVIVNNNPATVSMTPKPAYYACQTYARQLSGSLYQGSVNTGDSNVFCLCFAKGNLPCYALWASEYSYNLVLKLANGSYTLTNYDGSVTKQINVTNGALPLTIDGGPQYLAMNSTPAALPAAPTITLPSSMTSPGSFTVLDSPNGLYGMVMQGDGNLVIRNGTWATGTYGQGTAPYTATLQADGNLVVTSSNGAQLWQSNTANAGVAPYTLSVQNNGTAIIQDGQGKVTFHTGPVLPITTPTTNPYPPSVTSDSAFSELLSSNGQYSLIMQGDGNLVEYGENGSPIWASGSYGIGTAPYKVIMQGDGNLVIYQADGGWTWATRTYGEGVAPYTLMLQDNGTLVIEDSMGAVIFKTGPVIQTTPAKPGWTDWQLFQQPDAQRLGDGHAPRQPGEL